MVYKMLVLNIDGTLLQGNGRIHKLTREAIEYAVAKDIKVTLATSRNFPAAKRIAKSLKLQGQIVAHQGAFIAKELDKPVYVQRINEQITSEIVTLLESFMCQIKLVHETFCLANKMKLPDNMIAKVVIQTANRFSYPEQYVDTLSDKLSEKPVAPPHIEVVFENKADLVDVQQAITKMYEEVACIVVDPFTLHLVPARVSKLNGVKYLTEHLGIHKEEVVAIGAGIDDLPLIEWAGLGVAMGNAPTALQNAADWITRSMNDNGVSYMVKEHFRKQYKLDFLKKINVIK